MERWLPVPGWSRYEVSSLGNVRTTAGRVLKLTVAKNGYKYFQAREDGKKGRCLKVNVVVANAFLGERPPGFVCDHIDRNPLNNAIENLRYVTPRQNWLNCKRAETCANVSFANGTARLKNRWRVYFEEDGKRLMFGSYPTEEEAAHVASDIRARVALGEHLMDIKRSRSNNASA